MLRFSQLPLLNELFNSLIVELLLKGSPAIKKVKHLSTNNPCKYLCKEGA